MYGAEVSPSLISSVTDAVSDEVKTWQARPLDAIGAVPQTLEQMTFDNYRLIVASGDTWPSFQAAFGGTRAAALTKLNAVGEVRNILFHFKRPLNDMDYEDIKVVRDWLLRRTHRLGRVVEKPSHE
jgi:hypothetical protein